MFEELTAIAESNIWVLPLRPLKTGAFLSSLSVALELNRK
jgi:hypothetical protein